MATADFTASSNRGTTSTNDQKSRELGKVTADGITDQAKQVVSDTASTITEQAVQLLDKQVGAGAETIGSVATSIKRAADELDRKSPQLAGLARSVADSIDGYASNLRGKTAQDLFDGANNATRRNPALTFGLAAIAGFVAVRSFMSAPSKAASSQTTDRTGHFDGA